tara:strand:+ start:19962 stop:21815 length:1854 start_codon:yes stop_codon:yes gene_type:complete
MSDLIKKDVKYLNKDFAQFRQNLINFAKNYFPDTYQDFNESSPGMMFIEMASYVGDVLSYYTDTSFRESLLNSAQEDSNVLALSHLFGYKPKLNSPATSKLDVFQLVIASGSGENAAPDMSYALSIDSNMELESEEGVKFRTVQPIDFNDDPEISVYEIDGDKNVARYLLKKQVSVESGEIKQLEFSFDSPKPYDRITLPDTNVIDIVSIIDSAGNNWYNVDYLAQDTIFEDIANIPFNDPTLSKFRSTVPYILKLRKTPRRFITRLRDDNRLEIQFGSGISSDLDEEIIPNPKNVGMGLEYLKRTTTDSIDPTNFLYTSTYGIAPSNTTLTVRYTVGGAVTDNVGVNSITKINSISYLNETNIVDLSDSKQSVAVTNSEPATGGKSKDNIESIRQNAMAAFAAQNRAITREDYIARVYAMPSRFGSVAKAYIVGDTQINVSDQTYPSDIIDNPYALNLYLLAYNTSGQFVEANQALKENIRTYISQYRMLTDAINCKTAFIINLAVDFEIITRPNFNSNEVILACIAKLKTLLSNERMQINGPIDISSLISSLDKVNGVQSVVDFDFTNKVGGVYSSNIYDVKSAIKNNILYPSLDPCIFEIKYPNDDIKGRVIKP